MENASLEELRSLIEEEIYLIAEDREVIEMQLTANTELPSPVEQKAPHQSSIDSANDGEIASKEPVLTNLSTEKAMKESVSEPIPIRGNFSKGVLILHEEDALNTEVMEMLVKMIRACGHSMTEVGMAASSSLEGRSMEDFQDLNARTVLKFGRIKHPVNSISSTRYEVFSENETEYLFADSLSEISEDKNLKVKLWNSLQVLFNLSSK